MFGLAACARFMPAKADALNDLSLMPPVSVTMQARNEPDAPPPVEVAVGAAAGELVAAVGDVVAGALVLLPQAATSRLAAAAAAVVINAVCLTVSSTGPVVPGCPGITGLPPRPRLPAEYFPLMPPGKRFAGNCRHVVAESLPDDVSLMYSTLIPGGLARRGGAFVQGGSGELKD